LIPQLRWLAGELDAAIDTNDPRLTRRHLDSWRGQAAYIRGLLKDTSPTDDRISKLLQESVGLAFTANTALIEKEVPVIDACRQARESIGAVCDELSTWISMQYR
jgi:hypothetical protein